MNAEIAWSNLCVGYSAAAPVLRDSSCCVRGGELLAIIGPNGSGKTTLMRALCGVLRPFSGRVTVNGVNIAQVSPKDRARCIAVVSQRSTPLTDLTVWDVVLMGRYAHAPWYTTATRADKAAVEAALEQTHSAHLARRETGTLSGGEWQRVLLARAFAQEATVFLLDEPSAGLDPGRLVELFDVLERRRAEGAAIVAILHDINVAALYASRLVGLKAGSFLFDGPPKTVFTAKHVEDLYETPVTLFTHPVTGSPQVCLVPAAGAHLAVSRGAGGSGPDDSDDSDASGASVPKCGRAV